MRLLRREAQGQYSLSNKLRDDEIPAYAILSHTWGRDEDEVTFEDLETESGHEKIGYRKLEFCGEQAARDGLVYFWIDTCCIRRTSDAEISESINSMFRWYKRAAKCYVYLVDVSTGAGVDEPSPQQWEASFKESRWHTRCWTLQELLAPSAVEFYSREGKLLGNKQTLKRQLQSISKLPSAALQGQRLAQFSAEERMSWTEKRDATKVEDKAYCLLGILDVFMPPIYGEGENAMLRLKKEVERFTLGQKEVAFYQQLLRVTDPRHDKTRIETTKGGLVEESYRWVLHNPDFQQWQTDTTSRLLWIRGDPGKGKTMLLCGIINELAKQQAGNISYFFCQATDSRINNSKAAVRSLIYLLLEQQPTIVSHIKKKYDQAGRALLEDVNAWTVLAELLQLIIQDPMLRDTYLIIDALDEFKTGLDQLLGLVVELSRVSPRVKWIVSSRNWVNIENSLQVANNGNTIGLHLELNEHSVTTAVKSFIQSRVDSLAAQNRYDDATYRAVQQHLESNAHDTFLWVALVCEQLTGIPRRKVQKKLTTFPAGLDAIYSRMIEHILSLDDEDVKTCKSILAVVSTVYRPITLDQLAALVNNSDDCASDEDTQIELISLCGSFLTLRDRTIFFVHQSAKDFLVEKALDVVFPSGLSAAHIGIFLNSLKVLQTTLKRDIYDIGEPGFDIGDLQQPSPDPLAASRYSCVHWIEHLCYVLDAEKKDHPSSNNDTSISKSHSRDNGVEQCCKLIVTFFQHHFLHWLEALSLLGHLSNGISSLAQLAKLLDINDKDYENLINDGTRFILHNRSIIQQAPLQTYISSLLFSPTQSLIRTLFAKEEPCWVTMKPVVEQHWSPCLQTFEGYRLGTMAVTFLPDGGRVASGSRDGTIQILDTELGAEIQTFKYCFKAMSSMTFSTDGRRIAAVFGCTIRIWDAESGTEVQTLERHTKKVEAVAFSPDSRRIASGSDDGTVRTWDIESGKELQLFKGHQGKVLSVEFSPDGRRIVSGSQDFTVRIWDTDTGTLAQMFEGHRSWVRSVAFSPCGHRIASGSHDYTIQIWDIKSATLLQTLLPYELQVFSIAFSPDGRRIASGLNDRTVRVWDIDSGRDVLTLNGHNEVVHSVKFSPDGRRIGSVSYDRIVKIWDAESGPEAQGFGGHNERVDAVVFSPDGRYIASGSSDNTVKLWEARSGREAKTLKGHILGVSSVTFSPDSRHVASASFDSSVRVWDVESGREIQALTGHSASIESVTFSSDGRRIASGSYDRTVRIWDAESGAQLQMLAGHHDLISVVAFSPDGRRVASSSCDYSVKLWDLESGSEVQTFQNSVGWTVSITFSLDGHRVALEMNDGTVKIWDVESGIEAQTPNDQDETASHPDCHDDHACIRVPRCQSSAFPVARPQWQFEACRIEYFTGWFNSRSGRLNWSHNDNEDV